MTPTNASTLPAVFFTSGHRWSHTRDADRYARHFVLGVISIAAAVLLCSSQVYAAFAESHSTASVSLSAGVRPRMDFSLEEQSIVIKANTCWTLCGKTASGEIVTMRGEGSRELELEEEISEITVLSE